jgi:hypothetical protein
MQRRGAPLQTKAISASASAARKMASFEMQHAVVDRLQSLLSRASPLAQQLANLTAACRSLADLVVAARQSETASGSEGVASAISRRKEFLDHLSGVLAALEESQQICRDIEASTTAKADVIGHIILALRAHNRALTGLDLISIGPFSDCGVACSARAHCRAQLDAVSALVQRAAGTCITHAPGSQIMLGSECHRLQGLHAAVLECAPSLCQVVGDAAADALAALFTDQVFHQSACIVQESSSAGLLLRVAPLQPAPSPAIQSRLSAFADSLGCVAAALRASMPGPGDGTQPCLSSIVAAALVQRAGYKLCQYAADSAGDFSQAQKWSEALQELPPHAVVGTPPAATFWELWTDKRSVDAVNATQHQLLHMNASVCCNATE